jgi:membrane-associated phospholipid phosphatase
VGSLNGADRVVATYNLAVLVLLFAWGGRFEARELLVAGHLLLLVAIWVAARCDAGDPRSAVWLLHTWYPVLLLAWLYPEAGALRHSFFPHDFDPLVSGWDRVLFPSRPHLTLPPLLGVVGLEALHAAYFSYYLLLFLPHLVVSRLCPGLVRQYVFVLSACMCCHFAFGILFPVSGPVALRSEILPPGSFFIPLMEAVYSGFDRGGLAFPSTHAAAAVVAGWYAGRCLPRLRVLFALQVALILASTVLCTFHYAIDTVVGAATGALFLLLLRCAPSRRRLCV